MPRQDSTQGLKLRPEPSSALRRAVEEGKPYSVDFTEANLPAELVELTVVIGVYTLVSQVCSTFEIELEETPIADTGIEDIGKAVGKL